MYNLSEWTPISCAHADSVRLGLTPISSLTDIAGTYGTPIVYTEWGDDNETPRLREYRYPDSDRPCSHYVPLG
jgi:hypothetical protein